MQLVRVGRLLSFQLTTQADGRTDVHCTRLKSEREAENPEAEEKLTCSLVVLPLETSMMWKPVSPPTGMIRRPTMIIITIDMIVSGVSR